MSVTTMRTARLDGAPNAPGRLRRASRAVTRMVSTTLTVLISMVAAVTVVIAVAAHLSPQGQYVVFGHPVMTVLSGSMAPTISTGDLIVDDTVTTSQAEHLRAGEVISFRAAPGSETVITHRIVGVTTMDGAVSYLTKGDRNNAADTVPRPASDVLGVFQFAIPRGGYILSALQRPLVLVLLLASPILWLVAGLFYARARELEELERREQASTTAITGGPQR